MTIQSNSQKPDFTIKRSLTRTVMLGLVILALIPSVLLVGVTFLRSRVMLGEQASLQLKTIVTNHSQQLQALVNDNYAYLDEMIKNDLVAYVIKDILNNPDNELTRYLGWYQLSTYIAETKNVKSVSPDQVILVSPSGDLLLSSNREWENLGVGGIPFVKGLINKKSSVAVFNPANLYPDQWIIFSSKIILNADNQPVATAILATNAATSKNILNSASSLFPNAKAFFYARLNDKLIASNETNINQIVEYPASEDHLNQVKNLLSFSEASGSYPNSSSELVMAFAKEIPELNLGLVLEVPERIVYEQVNYLIPFSIIIFITAVLFGVLFTYFGARRFISPLIQLAQHAQKYAKGDFSQRAAINRTDEIGMLANSFNHMVEEIGDLYRSMETKVEERTSQLRTASEVGQLAISSSSKDQIIQRAVNLIVNRFGFTFSSIFMVDELGTHLVLQGYYSQGGAVIPHKSQGIPINGESLLGWVAQNNQARVATKNEIAGFSGENQDLVLGSSISEIAIPISFSSIVLGVLEVQSDRPNGFESDTIAVLQTLANQLANGLQNIRLLEATQINLEETTLLYRTSRQVSLTRNSEDLFAVLTSSLTQIPYISGIFSINADHISISALIDPANPTGIISTQGVTLPLQQIDERLTSNNFVLVDNLSKPTDYDHVLSFFARRGCRSAAIFPVFDSKKLVNLIVLGSRNQTPLSTTGLQPFSSLVEVISTTLERFRTLAELQHRVNELQALATLSEAISSETEPFQLFQALHKEISHNIGEDLSFAIALYDRKSNTINLPFLFENGEIKSVESFPLGEGLTSIIIRTKKPLFLNKDTETQALILGAKVLGKPAKSWMGIPLIVGGEPVGAMILQDTFREERFTEDDLDLLLTLAPQIATSVRNTQLLSQMQKTLTAYDQERFLLTSLMATTPDRIFFKDNQGRYLRVSRSFADDAGVKDPEEYIGKNVYNFLPSEQADEITEEETQVIDQNTPSTGRIEKGLHGSHEVWFQTSKVPLHDENGIVVGLIGISSDITSLKHTEEISQKRADQLQIAAEVARDTSSSLVIEETLQKSVNLIRDRFGFYHASIFLLDSLGNYAVLREATGEVGSKMVKAGHRLAVGSQSVVGQATSHRGIMVINDVLSEPNYYPNPLLAETRAEATIPLIAGDTLLGAIDVQSREVNAFSQDAIGVLKILADQVAIAVMNANLFARIQDNLGQHRLLHQITVATASTRTEEDALAITVEALKTSRGGDRVAIYIDDGNGILQLKASAGFDDRNSTATVKMGDGIIGLTALQRKPIRIDDAIHESQLSSNDPEIRSILAVPILYSNRVIGVLSLESLEPASYDETDQEILGSLGNTLGAILSNTQLVLTIQQQIERQRTLYEATNRIRRSVDIQNILSVSSGEICKALHARRAHIEITLGKDQPNIEPAPLNNGHKKPEGQS